MINDTDVFSDDILSGKPQISHGAEFHTDECIAMLHGAVAVRNTQYEGIVSKYSFKYFQQLLTLPKHYLDLGITPEQLKAAQDAIADLIYFDELFDSFIYYQYDDNSVVQKKEANKLKINKKIIDTIIKIDLDKVLLAIKERSKTRGHCYLPSGWIGDKIGHFSGIRVKPESDKQLLCVFLDRGAGINNHLLMAVSGGKLKYNYESDPFIVDNNKSFGLNFLEDIIRLNIDEKVYDKKECTIEQINVENNNTVKVTVQKNNTTIKHYSEDDLYGSSVKYSEKFLPPKPSKTNAVTQQRTGTCTVSNTKVVAQDAISFGFNVDLRTIKRFKFVIKLSSLIETFKAYCNQQCPYELMYWALQEFYVRINKHYPELLSDKEVMLCTKIGLSISIRLAKDNAELLEQRCAAKALPPLVGKWHALKQLLHIEENISTPTQAIKSVVKRIKLDKNGCTPEQILDYLEQARCYFNKKKHISNILEFRCFMHSLAKTSGNTDDPYWDRVNIQHLPNVIEKLVQLVQISMSLCSHHIDSMQFEIALIAYDIAAQIAPRIPELQLTNKYALVLDDVYSEECYFNDAITYHTVKHIVENFASRCAGKKYILSNAVNYDDSDATQEYVMNVLLTRDRYFKAINVLKEKNSIKSHVTHVPENELFTILMTKLCEVNFQKVAFETQDILGNLFTNLLTLSATTHHNRNQDCYLTAAKQANVYPFNNNENNYQRSKLYFANNVAFHQEIELADYLKNPTADFNQRVGLEKHFPKIDSDRYGYADFSENTIYHPHDDLIKKRSLKSTKNKQSFSLIGGNQRKEIFPYEISLSGSLRKGSSWGINSWQNVNNYEELDEDLRSIETSTQMQVVRALEWGQYYTEKLMHYEVRKRLFGLFFQYGNMDSALASSPSDTIELMNRFLTSGYDYYLKRALNPEYPDENLTVFIWLYNVHLYFVKYISVSANLYQFDTTDYQLPCVRSLLLEKISSNNAVNYINTLSLLLAASYWNKSDLSQDDYLILLQGQMCNKLSPRDIYVIHYTEIRLILESSWIEHKDALLVLLTAMPSQQLNICINRVMKFVNENYVACEWRIENSILISTDGKHSIDLNNGQLFRGEQQQKDLFRELNSSNFEILKKLGLLDKNVIDTLYDATAECIKTINGEYEILCPYSGSSRYIKQINRIIIIEGVSRKFKLLYDNRDEPEKGLASFFEKQNISSPFEKKLGKDYCYWISDDSEQMLFVDHYKKPEHAFLRSADSGWMQLISQNNQWMSNGKVIFDFNNPQADIEKQWVSRLEKMIGNSDALVLAIIQSDNQCTIESIKLSELGLEFINNNGRLASQDYPGYFLSEKQSLLQIKGLTSIIILVNDFGDEKYLVPHFDLKKPDGNSAFQHDDIIDRSRINYQFTNGELHYFIYEIDRNGNLVGNNLEADAYLAVLLSALGDYEHAMYALRRTEHHTNNSSSIVAIFELITIRQDQSPLGAAWAVKVASRMYRHMHKWAKHPNQFWKEKVTPKLVEFAYEQYLYYQKTVSHYKDEINIIPDYLRLEEHDVNALRALIKIREAQEGKSYPLALKPVQGIEHKVLINERLEEITFIEFCKDSTLTSLHDYTLDKLIEGLHLTDHCHSYQKNQYDLFLRTYFDLTEKIYCYQANYRIGEEYLKCYYVNFIEDAITGNAVTIKRLQAVLYSIIQNDAYFYKDNLLLTTLIFVIQNPHHFKNISKKTTRECFKEVAKQCYECVNKHGVPNKLQLFELNNGFINYIEEAILPNVFSKSNLLYFDLSSIKTALRYQHPLGDIFKIFFNATSQPLVKGDFALNEAEMEKPSLLEKNIINRLRSGHIVNQSKIKQVYRLVTDDMLLTLKKTLEIYTNHRSTLNNVSQQSINLHQQSNNDKIFIDQEVLRDPTTVINIKAVLKKREDDLLKLANYAPLDSDRPQEKAKAYLLLAVQGGHQRSEIAIGDLIILLLKQDGVVLSHKNCFLTQQQLSQLMEKLCDYLLLQSRVDQIEEALRLIGNCQSIAELGKYKEQLLGSIFSSQRTYDAKEYPEFLVYEYLTKRMLRPDQVIALKNLIALIKLGIATTEDIHHALLQFAAGGGKTSVLIIILSYVFARMGLMPVIFNTSELYDIAATDIPEYLKASLQQNMEVLERELEHKWTAAEMEKLYQDLNSWHQQKKMFID